jgi:CubicO group peptidase (beta-lactamase class C family)
MKKSMRRMAVPALFCSLALGTQVGCRTRQAADEEVARKIQAVESGLLEFTPGAQLGGTPPSKFGLAERMAGHKIPGVSIAVINGGRVEWAKAYGVLRVDTGAPVTTGSIFQAASTTKMLVAAVVLHFVAQGRLDLDRDVNEYLKSWSIPDNELTAQKKVTLRLLLTHQSGLPMTNFPYDEGPPPSLVQVLKGEAPARNKPAVVGFVPGSKWQYSNIGYVVIQQVLEDLEGRPLSEIMEDVIFRPLGMKSSTLSYPLKPAWRPREAWPHDEEGRLGEPSLHPTAVAQGGLMTTPTDLALFVAELMHAYRGESDWVLSPEAAREMLRPELDLDPALLGIPLREGLGVLLTAAGEPFGFGHPGDNFPGASCWAWGHPDREAGIVIMTNGAKGNLLAMEIMPAFVETYIRSDGP